MFAIPLLSKIYALIIPVVGFYLVIRNKNSNHEVILVSAYLVGVEVFLRMTGGNLNNEYIKLCVIIFMIIGMLYKNFAMGSLIYGLFLLLLIPGILVAREIAEVNFDTDLKKAIMFNLSGPVCLGIASLYMYKRRILFTDLQKILKVMGLPIISTVVYLFLFNPSIKDVVTGTQSNFETSGGFGPNQVSTILGLGMFVFFSQLVLFSKSKGMIFLNGILFVFITYRGLATFSRGGIITGVAMIVCLIMILYLFSNAMGKAKVSIVIALSFFAGLAIWGYTSMQTRGLIEKRYANKDARGREKKDRLGGREAIMDADYELFLENPIMGIGVGIGKELRKESLGQEVASHNEITRMISEHGLFGIFGLFILFLTPFTLYINNRQHLYFLSFFVFWMLTINHAAMRIAAPAFIYSLSLLSVQIKNPEKTESPH